MQAELKKTPLYEAHIKAGGKMVEYAGYLMPVSYPAGIIEEHMAVRQKAGIFDVSHMGVILFEGPKAFDNVQMLFTNDFTGMAEGSMRYSLMCNDEGGILDDILVYRLSGDKYIAVVNASNKVRDLAWIKSRITDPDTVSELSGDSALIALQGPRSEEILGKLVSESSKLPAKPFSFVEKSQVAGKSAMVSRSGYTGEDGFEILVDAEDGLHVWDALLEAGAGHGLAICGLGARDTLRMEASMPLYGNELSEQTTPFEASLGWAVKLGKDDFIGKEALEKVADPDRIRVGLEIVGRGIARGESAVFAADGREIGLTTSGTMSPYLKKAIAMAMVDKAYAKVGTKVEIDVRGRKLQAELVKMPFYKR